MYKHGSTLHAHQLYTSACRRHHAVSIRRQQVPPVAAAGSPPPHTYNTGRRHACWSPFKLVPHRCRPKTAPNMRTTRHPITRVCAVLHITQGPTLTGSVGAHKSCPGVGSVATPIGVGKRERDSLPPTGCAAVNSCQTHQDEAAGVSHKANDWQGNKGPNQQ